MTCTATETAPRRDWLGVGESALAEGTEHEINDGGEWTVRHRPIPRERVERAIPHLQWFDPDGVSFPMSPALAIRGVVEELRLPRVSLIAYQGEDGYASTSFHNYCLYGIEANYKDGRARLYVLDRGHDVVPICVDFWPKEVTA